MEPYPPNLSRLKYGTSFGWIKQQADYQNIST